MHPGRLMLAAVLCIPLLAQRGTSVSELVNTVRAQLQIRTGDSRIARSIRRVKLIERLDDRTIETVESEGAGPETVFEMLRLRDESVRQPMPAVPVIAVTVPPSVGEQEEIWRMTSENSRNYLTSLPDFICTEIIRRYKDPGAKLLDTLTVKLSYFDHKEDYKMLTVNGRPAVLSYQQASGSTSEGEFGSALAAVFADVSKTEYHWDHWTTLRKRATHVYFFRVAVSHSRYQLDYRDTLSQNFTATVGWHGYLYVDAESNRVVRIAWETEDIPVNFPVRMSAIRLDYAFIDIAGQKYLLPWSAQTRMEADAQVSRNETEFLEYRKFSAETTITFGK